MRGLKAKDLVAVVDFIYNGEAKIYPPDLERFLTLAQEIRIEGLSRKQGYFIVEKGKETPLPVKDISKTGPDLYEDGIDSAATNLQKPHSEDKETKSQSNNSVSQESVVLEDLPEASLIEIDYEDLETVLPFAEKIQIEGVNNVDGKCSQKSEYPLKGVETKENVFPFTKDEQGMCSNEKDVVHKYTELKSNTNIHFSTERQAQNYEEELGISKNNIEKCEEIQKSTHEYTKEHRKTEIPSPTNTQAVTSPRDNLTVKNIPKTDNKIFFSADISKEQLEKRIDELIEKIDADENI